MDRVRFDSLARALARRLDRRTAVAAALGLAASVPVARPAAAATACRAGRQTCSRDSQCCSGACQTGRGVPLRDRNRCTCADGETVCGNRCIDTTSDPRNCGGCGIRCPHSVICTDGACIDPDACVGSDALFCLVGIDYTTVEIDTDCVDIDTIADSCSSHAECQALLDDIIAAYPEGEAYGYQTLCIRAAADMGVIIDGFPDGTACLVYALGFC